MTALEHMAARMAVTQRGLAQAQQAVAAAQRRLQAGTTGEALVEHQLVEVGVWHLAGRMRPGSRRADIDFIVASRSGVFVIDVKHWADVSVEGGRLFHGQDDCSDALDSVVAQARDVEEALTSTGLSPLEVHPLLVFSRNGSALEPQRLGRLVIVGVDHLRRIVTPSADRLPALLLAAVREQLEAAFPPDDPEEDRTPRTRAPASRRKPPPGSSMQMLAFDLEELDIEQVRFADSLPLEQWMIWLDPVQHPQVRRTWGGPARVRGPAGTGKTVLALQRAAYLAEASPGRVLVTSYVRTLPAVLSTLYRRLSPATAGRVDFMSLHSLAWRIVRDRMLGARLDEAAIESSFNVAWVQVGRANLERFGLGLGYWKDEIDAVIKGRDLRHRNLYLEADRIGRRTALGAGQRAAVWDLYEAYEAELCRRRVCDWNDILRMARDSLTALPLENPYRHVVADEVQDFPTVGLQLLRRLVPEQPDDMFLVGDGQQSVYPGGGTLKEAGIAVTGRGVALNVNYRNPKEILEAALDIIAEDRFDDLEGVDEPGLREIATRRDGGTLIIETFVDTAAQDAGLVKQILADAAAGCRLGGMAVLVATRSEAAHFGNVLRSAGVAVQPLATWDGVVGDDAVKVGTVKRSKGLEFDAVYLAGFDPRPSAGTEDEQTRRRREAFVAMTRARSRLWTGRSA